MLTKNIPNVKPQVALGMIFVRQFDRQGQKDGHDLFFPLSF